MMYMFRREFSRFGKILVLRGSRNIGMREPPKFTNSNDNEHDKEFHKNMLKAWVLRKLQNVARSKHCLCLLLPLACVGVCCYHVNWEQVRVRNPFWLLILPLTHLYWPCSMLFFSGCAFLLDLLTEEPAINAFWDDILRYE